MDNQQERSRAWLAGILDGEGTISFQVYTMPDQRVRVTPFLCVVNSDPGVLRETKAILDEMTKGKKFSDARICNPGTSAFSQNKRCSTIRLDGTACGPVIAELLPYLRSDQKSESARAVLQYLKLRDTQGIKRDAKGRVQRKPYTREQIELICSIRSHKRAKSSEAICGAPNVVG